MYGLTYCIISIFIYTYTSIRKPYILQIYISKKALDVFLSSRTGSTVGFEKVFVAQKEATAAQINAAIAKGKHVVLTPHVYHLEEPIAAGPRWRRGS